MEIYSGIAVVALVRALLADARVPKILGSSPADTAITVGVAPTHP